MFAKSNVCHHVAEALKTALCTVLLVINKRLQVHASLPHTTKPTNAIHWGATMHNDVLCTEIVNHASLTRDEEIIKL